MIYNIEFETLPREALEAIQLRRLQATIERVYATVPFYRKKFQEAGVTPSDIKTLNDLQRLPFTYKQDLRDNYPFGMFAVPMDNVVRIHASSGTTGKPTVVGYTARDISTWSELMARALAAAGASRGDIIHNAYGYGLFTGGLGVHYGAERLGASVIPISGGNTKRQILIMKDFGPTILTCTPSYALHLAEVAGEVGVDFKDLRFKAGIFGAEPWSEEMRQEIERKLHLSAVDIYGLSEVLGPGVAVECAEAKKGLHIAEDHFIAEVIHPETGETLPYGEKGELVFTSITKEAFPVIRYRTRDISSLNPEPCICGRSHVRMNRVTGRTDDMLIIRGVNVFPSQIESVLMEIEGVEPHYQLVVDREDNLDLLTVMVEVGEDAFSDEVRVLQVLEKKISKNIKEYLGVSAKVKLVEPKSIARSEGKAQRVIDNRKI
ncbi:phenylacetate--CoA ligase family protein [Desulforhabdus amnigena]|jgi:phenylacetate-CoA ligase|uniref:Phenylacetate-coenzyme A ligase n=1 Tax=Desulforhabdus amnigena TaxID=40218 RepID=A0A9W6CY90_9BACT|nr:phenylacetate--CoA ligase [Desulforhabdus amnigena]NLJ29556.1 phenylacetate--CoA ligase [Deltaproteobacteria bacterium]GLI34021.1 phenylacetate-coenzyme A ligase [Desulforhabdus amnigena]